MEKQPVWKRERNFGLWRRPTWIIYLFNPPPIQCPHDKGMEVEIYFSGLKHQLCNGALKIYNEEEFFYLKYICLWKCLTTTSNVVSPLLHFCKIQKNKECVPIKPLQLCIREYYLSTSNIWILKSMKVQHKNTMQYDLDLNVR